MYVEETGPGWQKCAIDCMAPDYSGTNYPRLRAAESREIRAQATAAGVTTSALLLTLPASTLSCIL